MTSHPEPSLRHPFVLLAVSFVAACNPTPPADSGRNSAGEVRQASEPWLLGPNPEADLLHAEASEASLRTQFGTAAVQAESIYVGEGFSDLGTVLFPDDSGRRLAIVWQDTIGRARPAYVYVTGQNNTWRLFPGVGIGTDLKTLEALNTRPFELSGFAWDYSGTTVSFGAGHLDSLWRRGEVLGDAVLLRLDPSAGAPDSVTSQVVGDRTFSSQHPAMQRLNPRVYQIVVRPR